jgi:phytol kinase
MLSSNWVALVVTFALALIWLRLNDFFAHRGWISGPLSRKIIHMGTGPIFVLCWLLFNDQDGLARYLAALVPLAITLQFVLVGTGIIKDPAAVQAMSRTGDRREILRGPLYYGIAFVVLTILFWKDSPVGIVALMILCGGDGLADVLGKRLRSNHLPWSQRKTWVGSASMLIGGWLFALVIVAIYVGAGQFTFPFSQYIPGITLISLAAAAVESLPLYDIDNVTVPIVSVLLGLLLFK